MKTLKISFLLAFRSIQRSSLWTSLLIIMIMTITFLNLVAVRGILVGLVIGSRDQQREFYSSDIIIKPAEGYSYIRSSEQLLSYLSTIPEVKQYAGRYIIGGTIQGDFKSIKKENESRDSVSTQLVGIDVNREVAITKLDTLMIEGEFLEKNDYADVVLGSRLVERYNNGGGAQGANSSIKDVQVGDKVRLVVNGETQDVTVKGILKSKSDRVAGRAFFTDNFIKQIAARSDLNRSEIIVQVAAGYTPEGVKEIINNHPTARLNIVEDWLEAQGQFLTDIASTFGILGNVIGSIGLFIASITIFIIIFINAVNHQKYIGIMKAIGISQTTIIGSYIFQSLFYAGMGTGLGMVLVFGFLEPFFRANPINFPFSDGILAITLSETLVRVMLLCIVTLLAGFIPARLIVSKNTINAILGR